MCSNFVFYYVTAMIMPDNTFLIIFLNQVRTLILSLKPTSNCFCFHVSLSTLSFYLLPCLFSSKYLMFSFPDWSSLFFQLSVLGTILKVTRTFQIIKNCWIVDVLLIGCQSFTTIFTVELLPPEHHIFIFDFFFIFFTLTLYML
jgi:hypothetical protein